jgi:hypothetical protein
MSLFTYLALAVFILCLVSVVRGKVTFRRTKWRVL